MKKKNVVILIIGLVLGLAACKNQGDNSLIGKWQQIKLRTYTQSYSGSISHDTSYQKSSFDTSNYARFSNDGTCIIGIFYPPGSYNPVSDIARISAEKYNYSVVGTKYILTLPTTLIYPSGFITTDTASVNANTLLIHSVFDNHQDYTVSDAYYTR